MKSVDLCLEYLREAAWNPNYMNETIAAKLRNSIARYGMVGSLVVRPLDGNTYEVLSGNQRLEVLRELGYTSVPCVVVELDDTHARLLAQALNRIQGEDDLGLRAELLRTVLETLPQEEVLAVLPDSALSLEALSSLGQDNLADYLENWQRAQSARLKHLTFQLRPSELEVVEEALAGIMSMVAKGRHDSPNRKGTALYLLCKTYLERNGDSGG